MTEDTQNQEHQDTGDTEDEDSSSSPSTSLSEEHKKLLQAMVSEQLSKMKSSMDKMSKERDAAIREKARLEEEAREAKVKQLEEDGKVVESLEMKLTAEKEKATILQERLDKVTRDNKVAAALRGIEFRNANAANLAEKSILDQLTKDKDGNWVHRSGASIDDFVKTFFSDEDNEFLLKPKVNQGTKGPDGSDLNSGKPKRPKSLEGLSSQQLLEMARNGAL
jgi:predicted RNase H-like nuclease (RuvC/YqgF family)